jgi:hypothetical protein
MMIDPDTFGSLGASTGAGLEFAAGGVAKGLCEQSGARVDGPRFACESGYNLSLRLVKCLVER